MIPVLRRLATRLWGDAEARRYSRFQERFDLDASFTEVVARFPDCNSLYAYMHHYFHHRCPEVLRQHREFFKREQRGFGEDALHAMWWLILREFKPVNCLEIGVYRGQVISLWSLIARSVGYDCQIHGISPFTPAGDQVSTYRADVDYMKDTLEFFHIFELPAPILVRSLSTEHAALEHISAHRWDLIYIDGSHDYEVVLADYQLCREYLNVGGLLVLDDSSLGTAYRPPLFAFGGHPGPSRVCQEVTRTELSIVGAVGHNSVFVKGAA
jgi:predicted O-methyltransferase YrrM